jgi:hypothetical protein
MWPIGLTTPSLGVTFISMMINVKQASPQLDFPHFRILNRSRHSPEDIFVSDEL